MIKTKDNIKTNKKQIILKRGEYTVREIDSQTNKKIMQDIYKLRHRVYCQELNWIKSKNKNIERDRYDNGSAVYFGVFRLNNLVGTSRIIQHSSLGFMLQNEFKVLLDEKELNKLDFNKVVEVTRLAVHPDYRRSQDNGDRVSNYLYKIMYKWSRQHKKRFWIFVVEQNFFNKLKNQFFVPLKIIGVKHEFTKGIITVPVLIDLGAIKRDIFFHLMRTKILKYIPSLKFIKNGN